MLKLFITDLSAYNEGYLIGKWIRLPLSNEHIHMAISEVLCEGEAICGSQNHEELFTTDWEFEEIEFFQVEEYDDVYKLNDSIKLLDKLDTSMQKAVAFLLNEGITVDVEDAILRAHDVIIHENQTLEDVAYELLEECYGVYKLPAIIANNIDYEAVARELECDGTYWESGGDVYEYCG
jgi:antirestriction protein